MTTKFTKDFIAAELEKAARATARPWTFDRNNIEDRGTIYAWAETPAVIGKDPQKVDEQVIADYDFAESAANHYEAALMEIQRLQDVNRNMKKQLDIATDLGQKRFEREQHMREHINSLNVVEEIERLTKRERRDCAAIIELRKNLKDANKKLDSADSLLEEISIWFYKNIGNSEPLWKDKFVSVCQMFEPEMTHKDRKK